MPNPHKGEVGFDCNGESYTLRFSANALCELEDALDLGINAIAAQLGDVGNLRLKTVRAVFWAGLRDRHSAMTLRDAGEIVTTLTLPTALELVGKAFEAAFPTVEGEAARPPQPGLEVGPAKMDDMTAAGSGPRSSENGASADLTTKDSGAARRAISAPASPPARPS